MPDVRNALIFTPDNSFDVGASGATRPRDAFLGRNLNIGGTGMLADGSSLTPSLVFTNSQTTGLYRQAADSIGFATNGLARWAMNASGHFIAPADSTYDIGALGATRPRDLFLGRNLTVGGTLTLPNGSVAGAALADGGVTNVKLASDVARPSMLVNGGFEVWQRGNGAFTGASSWGPDGWVNSFNGTDALSVTRETTTVDAGSGSSALLSYTKGTGTFTEHLRSLLYKTTEFPQLKGRTVTFSARIFCGTANVIRLRLNNFYSCTDHITTSSNNVAGGGSWQTLSVTSAVDATATFVIPSFSFLATGNAYVDNAMLVIGSAAADYVPLPPADDLARCLRYYEAKVYASNQYIATGQAYTTSGVIGVVPYLVRKCVTPTITFSAGSTFAVTTSAFGVAAATTVGMAAATVDAMGLQLTGASGLVAGNASIMIANTGSTASIFIEAIP